MGVTGVGDATNPFNQPQTATSASIMGRDDFLALLITQLKNQDPLSPMDQQEMIGQLTQFNQLDELQQIKSGLQDQSQAILDSFGGLARLQESLINAQSVSLVGRNIRAVYEKLHISPEAEPRIVFDVPDGARNVTLTVLDSSGATVRVEELGEVSGEQHYDLTSQGIPEGNYTVRIEATLADGTKKPLDSYIEGTVERIWFSSRGAVLEVDGQIMSLAAIAAVMP